MARFSMKPKKCSPDRNGSFADKKVRRERASRHRLRCQMALPMVWSGIFIICYLEYLEKKYLQHFLDGWKSTVKQCRGSEEDGDEIGVVVIENVDILGSPKIDNWTARIDNDTSTVKASLKVAQKDFHISVIKTKKSQEKRDDHLVRQSRRAVKLSGNC